MSKKLLLLLAFVMICSQLIGQVLEVENTQELSKDARKGELLNFHFDPGSSTFMLLYGREKGNKIYQFNYDLKLVNNETLD